MDAIERNGAAPEALILEAALECLGDDSELKDLKQADIERMAEAVAGAIPERWDEIRALLPRLKKKSQNAIIHALLRRKPPLRDPSIYITCASICQELDVNYRAGMIARLSRLGETAEAGRQLIPLLQEYADGAMRPGPLGRISINDCTTLHNLLIERAAELMLFHKAVLRISLDWNIRLNAEPVERRRLIGSLAKLLAKLKWRDISDDLLEPWLNALNALAEAGSITLSPEWPMLFKMILKQLRHRPTDPDVLLALGKLIRTGAGDAPAAARIVAKPAPRPLAPVQTPRKVYDPQGGALSSASIYPPHVVRQMFQHTLAPASFVGGEDEPTDENAPDDAEILDGGISATPPPAPVETPEAEVEDLDAEVEAGTEPEVEAEETAEETGAPEEEEAETAVETEEAEEAEGGGVEIEPAPETSDDEAAEAEAAGEREAIALRLDQMEATIEAALAEIQQIKAKVKARTK